jgi:hypothetical protein
MKRQNVVCSVIIPRLEILSARTMLNIVQPQACKVSPKTLSALLTENGPNGANAARTAVPRATLLAVPRNALVKDKQLVVLAVKVS